MPPPPKEKRQSNWADRETKALIDIWRETNVTQEISRKTTAKKAVWEVISLRLQDLGYEIRPPCKIMHKVKALKKQHREMNDRIKRSGAGTHVLSKCPYYYTLDEHL